jgi:hypothetical protein
VPQRVLGASGSTSFFDAATARGLTRYVERERELLVLRDAWEQASAAHGGVISIGGGPGVGKTRLLHEFRAYVTQQAHGEAALVLHGRCSAYRNVAPYQPFIDALTGPLASLREQYPLSNHSMTALTYLFAPGAAQTPLPERSHDAALRDAIIDGLTEVLITIAQQRPLLLMLEDWHCADDASRATLRQLSQRIDASRILLTINYRSTELTAQAQPKARVHIDLAPLDVAMTEAMARSLLGGGRMPAGLSDFVHSRTLGNPFFVEEICRALLERGTCVQQGDAIVLVKPLLQFRAPSTVQAMVRARIDRLPGAHRDLLRLAAVIGAQFTFELIEASATGELPQPSAADTPARAALLAQLAELETQDLIHRVDSSLPPVYRFKHAITQEVVYESLPVQQRRHHHGRLAQLIEARCPKDELETQYEPLAHHYQRSAHTDKAIAYSVLAGDKAWRAFALEQAARQYRHALGVLARVAPADDAAKLRHIDVSLSWARASVYNPDAEQVTALHDSLRWASELADQRRTCLCLNWLSWLEHALGNQRSALAYSEQFRQAATELGETRLLAQALINAGVSHAMATDYGRAVASIEQGLQARARFTGTAYGYAQGYLAMICGDQGDFERAYAFLAQASAAIGVHSHITLQGPLLIQRAMIECWQESWQACIATSMRAREIAERIEGNYILGMSLSLEGHARFMASGDEAALGLQREAVALLDAHGIRLHMSMTLGLLAESLAHAGAYDEAEATLGAARARIAEHDRLGEVAALRAAAWIAGMRDRDVGSAKRWMQEAVAAAEAKHSGREQALCEAALRGIVQANGGR